MTSDRIKEIQKATAHPDSVSVQQALFKVWNECAQEVAKEREKNEAKANELIKALENCDELLVHFEDFTHGSGGFNITKERKAISEAIKTYKHG